MLRDTDPVPLISCGLCLAFGSFAFRLQAPLFTVSAALGTIETGQASEGGSPGHRLIEAVLPNVLDKLDRAATLTSLMVMPSTAFPPCYLSSENDP